MLRGTLSRETYLLDMSSRKENHQPGAGSVSSNRMTQMLVICDWSRWPSDLRITSGILGLHGNSRVL